MPVAMPDLSQFSSTPDRSGDGPDVAKYKSMYYRQPNGWIILAPAHPDAYSDYGKQGWTALHPYGEFRDHWIGSDELGKLETLFRKGGAKEFSLEQILISGWHRKPPFGVTFPQLEGLDHKDVQCPTCRKPFVRREHLENHELIAHKELASNSHLARAISDAQGAPTADLAGAMASLMASQAILLEKMSKQDDRFMALLERLAPATTGPAKK